MTMPQTQPALHEINRCSTNKKHHCSHKARMCFYSRNHASDTPQKFWACCRQLSKTTKPQLEAQIGCWCPGWSFQNPWDLGMTAFHGSLCCSDLIVAIYACKKTKTRATKRTSTHHHRHRQQQQQAASSGSSIIIIIIIIILIIILIILIILIWPEKSSLSSWPETSSSSSWPETSSSSSPSSSSSSSLWSW